MLASSSVAVVPVERSGMGSGANSTFRQVGIATGIAGLGAVFASQIQHHTVAALSSTAAGQQVLHRGGSQLAAAMQSGSVREAAAAVPPPARNVLLHAYRIGFSHTFNELMVIGAVIAFVGAVLTLVLVRQRDFVTNMVGSPAGGAETRRAIGSEAGADAAPAGAPGAPAGSPRQAFTMSGTVSRPPARARGRPRDERVTRAITEAALRQLLDEGYSRLSMESVASEAGVARATVYRRFKDKADLVTAAIAGYAGSGVGPWASGAAVVGGPAEVQAAAAGEGEVEIEVAGRPGAASEAMNPSADPRADLERFLIDFDDRFNRSCIEVLGGLLADREDPTALALHRERVIEPRRAYARSLLEQARDAGELDPAADLDLALDMLTGVVIARAVGGRDLEAGWAQRALDLVWRGAGASP